MYPLRYIYPRIFVPVGTDILGYMYPVGRYKYPRIFVQVGTNILGYLYRGGYTVRWVQISGYTGTPTNPVNDAIIVDNETDDTINE